MAGKTGTAQRISRNRDSDAPATLREGQKNQALFIGYAPTEGPRIAVAVVVEQGGSGSGAAAPVARKIFDVWLGAAGEAAKGEVGNRESEIVDPPTAVPSALPSGTAPQPAIPTPTAVSPEAPTAAEPRATTNSPQSRLPIPDARFPMPGPP